MYELVVSRTDGQWVRLHLGTQLNTEGAYAWSVG